MRKNLQNTKFQTPNTSNGITLIALVITIIVLLILAGVAINMAIDSDGLFGKANEAAEKWNTALGEEEGTINDLLNKLDEMVPSPMITKWNIAAGDTVKLYLYRPSDIEGNALENNTNVTIDWGDGTVETINSENMQQEIDYAYGYGRYYVTHSYSITNDETTITITGKCNEIGTELQYKTNTNLTSIEQWGNTGSISYRFINCINLTSIAEPEKNTFAKVKVFDDAFSGCTSLQTIPEGLFANCVNVTSFGGTFSDCTSLETIPEGLFANCVNATSFYGTFWGCTSLELLPQTLFDECAQAYEFSYTFSGCTGLNGNSIPLWERFEEAGGYYLDAGTKSGWCKYCKTYRDCTGLSDYDEIPNAWK